MSNLEENKEYSFTAGGVTRMVYPLLRKWLRDGVVENPHWVSLNTLGPDDAKINGITLNHVRLEQKRLTGYGYAKETMWRALHGIQKTQEHVDSLLWREEFVDYTYYNRVCSERVAKLDEENDFDVFYIHDFQQLPMAHMLHTLKPKVFRWHIPFDEGLVPKDWRQYLASFFNSYDVVIVSCKKYLESLRRFGYTGDARHIYPHLDQTAYGKPSKADIRDFEERFGISPDERVVLVVARLDPMKGQDRAIMAFARVAKNFPKTKLVLVGNGSFSSSKGGIGLPKAQRWLGYLRNLVKKLKLEKRVVFTGHLDHGDLQSAYQRSELTVLPSVLEGFGLVVIESWLYRTPAIVSSAAGVAELVKDKENGLLFDVNDPNELADKISMLLSDRGLAENLGKNGYNTSKLCSLGEGANKVAKVMFELVGARRG